MKGTTFPRIQRRGRAAIPGAWNTCIQCDGSYEQTTNRDQVTTQPSNQPTCTLTPSVRCPPTAAPPFPPPSFRQLIGTSHSPRRLTETLKETPLLLYTGTNSQDDTGSLGPRAAVCGRIAHVLCKTLFAHAACTERAADVVAAPHAVEGVGARGDYRVRAGPDTRGEDARGD